MAGSETLSGSRLSAQAGPEGASQSPRPSEAAQSLSTILKTQYLRYWLIASWALGLLATVGWRIALIWFVATSLAGLIRGMVEKRVAARVGNGYGMVFPVVAGLTTTAWATAPALAWFSGAAFGQPLAMALLSAGYLLVFAQMGASWRQSLVISAPYTVVALWIAASLIGSPLFWPFVAVLPFLASGLFVKIVLTLVREEKINSFQAHQAHLIAELEAARDKANAANEAKSSFLGVISHELRTPMNGVLGAAQLLSATRLDATQREYISIVRNSGDSLLTLLNDILDMTKIEAGRMAFDMAEVNVDDLHRRVTGVASAQAQAKGLAFETRLTGDVPARVRGDGVRVGQILQNLLSNAIKFTDSGQVLYEVHCTRLSDRRAGFRFEVTDTGPGIAPEDLGKLFEPFTQLDASSTRRFGGTGLGLTISRRLANIMGGDIKVKTELGKGSTFIFEVEAEVLSWRDEAPAHALTAEVADGRSLRVLIVEDHPVNRMIIEAWMASAGHSTASAENGAQALEVAATEAFDLVIMDVNMPVMDGLTATQQLRSRPGPNRDTPVVVLSASARVEDHEAGISAGADAYLNKPIDFVALAEVLNRCVGGRAALREAA